MIQRMNVLGSISPEDEGRISGRYLRGLITSKSKTLLQTSSPGSKKIQKMTEDKTTTMSLSQSYLFVR